MGLSSRTKGLLSMYFMAGALGLLVHSGSVGMPVSGAALQAQTTGNTSLVLWNLTPTAMYRGTSVTIPLALSNSGLSTATSVNLDYPIPTGFVFNAAGSTPGCSVVNQLILCSFPTIASKQGISIRLVFSIPTVPSCTTKTITSQANAIAGNAPVVISNTITSSIYCTTPVCGDGLKEGPEQCDDGNGKPGDGCSTSCKTEVCGDLIVTPSKGEECDGGSTMSKIIVSTTPAVGCHATSCKYEYCGDGKVQTYLAEACDDGNRRNGDACSATCRIPAGQLALGINGPATQMFSADDNDAVLGNITTLTGPEALVIEDLFVLVLGNTSTGGLLCGNGSSTGIATNCRTGFDDSIAETMEGVELRNTTSGLTVPAVRLTGSMDSGHATAGSVDGTYQIYRFDHINVSGSQTWEFRTDFIDNGSASHPENGDKFKIYVCGEPRTTTSGGINTAGCFTGIFTTPQTAYQMDVVVLANNAKVNTVTPRGTIAGNFHSISRATLSINVQAQSTMDTIVHNSQDVTFHRFEARAGDAEDVLLTKVVLEAQAGSAVSNASNYTLWVDRDGDRIVDAILQDGVAAQGSSPTISFAELEGGGYVIPKEATVIFEVHGDIASSPSNNQLQLKLATWPNLQYIEAEEVDDGSSLAGIQTNGTCVPAFTGGGCDITVTTINSTLYTLVPQGDLFVNKDSSPLRNRQYLGGALGEAGLRLEFRAENEDIDVTDLRISSSGSLATSIDVLELYKDNATTPFALASRNGCPANALNLNPYAYTGPNQIRTFCANMETDQLIVPEGTNVDVIVRPRLYTDTQGAVSNQTLWFWVNDATTVLDNSTGAILARGNDSSNDLIANNGNATANGEIFIGRTTPASTNLPITGNKNVSVLAKIMSIANANSAANGSAIQTGVVPFGQFAITSANNSNSANGYNDTVLSGVIFNVNATNVSISTGTFKLYNKDNSSTKASCVAFKAGATTPDTTVHTGTLFVRCADLVIHPINTEIDPGATMTLVLEANVLNANTSANSNSSLQASITSFSEMTKSTFGITATDTKSHIIWNDTDSAVRGTFTWIEYPESIVNSTSYRG